MIKKILVAVGFVLAVGVNANASEGDFSVGLNIGQASLISNNMDQYGTVGFGVGGFLTYAPSDMFDVNVDLVYSPHGKGGNEANSIYGTMDLRMLLKFDEVFPFIAAGAGFYRNSLSGVNAGSATTFGFNAGLGLDVKLGKRFVVGIITKYHPVFDKELSAGVPAIGDFWDAMLRFGFTFNNGISSSF